MNKQKFEDLLKTLTTKIKDFEDKYGLNVCDCFLDWEDEDLPVESYIVKPTGHRYENFYTFTNDFFNVQIDGWYHNYSGWTKFPYGFKSGLTRLIKSYCEENGLYCELRKAYRITNDLLANTCVFLIAIK